MTSLTAKYSITKPAGTDLVRSGDDHIRLAMDRIDLLLGESGTVNITPSAANTDTALRVNYARSYATLAPLVPRALANINESINAAAAPTTVWTSAEDATGFTLNIRSATTGIRSVKWRCGV